MSTIASPSALRTVALQNPGLFAALFARAPKTVTYRGKTYLRDSARSVDERLWFLAAAASTSPASVASIARGSYSLDEVYGLDPDRSTLDAAEQRARDAKGKVGKVRAALDGVNRRIRDAEARLTEALAAQKEAQKVQVGDIFTAGISAAGRNLYADGQVQYWKDVIQSLKSGVVVGMAGNITMPPNGGQAQLEGALKEAQAEARAAEADVTAARRAYNDEARKLRREEEQARAEQARDDAERRRAEAEARARDEAAAAAAEASYVPAEPSMTDNVTDPGYVTDDGETWTGDDSLIEELDTARDLFGNEEDAQAYAEDVLGVDDVDALLSYVSPYSFDAYYGADCGCDGCARGAGDCDTVDSMRVAMLDAGWGYDVEESYGADKLTEPGEQGYTGDAPAASFDFAAVIPVIIAAVLSLAPLLLKAFGAPSSLAESEPPASTRAAIPPPPAPPSRDTSTDAPLAVGGALLLVKLLG